MEYAQAFNIYLPRYLIFFVRFKFQAQRRECVHLRTHAREHAAFAEHGLAEKLALRENGAASRPAALGSKGRSRPRQTREVEDKAAAADAAADQRVGEAKGQ